MSTCSIFVGEHGEPEVQICLVIHDDDGPHKLRSRFFFVFMGAKIRLNYTQIQKTVNLLKMPIVAGYISI